METLKSIQKHRSIRKYKPDLIPEAMLTEILQAGIRASSSGNMQSYSIIVTRDRAIREKLYEAHKQQKMVLDAPILVTFCADFHRMRKWLKLNNAPDNFDNFMSFMIAAIDATLVSQNVAIAAVDKGLGICYMGSTLANCDQIGKILQVPKGVFPVVGFSLGYPDEAPALRDRLPLSGLVHDEIYQDYSDEQITDIYSRRDKKGWTRYMRAAWMRKMVEKKGVENLAQIYTRIKYLRESHQDNSKKVLDYLEEQNFMEN